MSKKLLLSVSIFTTITLLSASQDTGMDDKLKNEVTVDSQETQFNECHPFPRCLVWPQDVSADSIPLAFITDDELSADGSIDLEKAE